MPRQSLIQFRGGTASQWTSANPVLALGEPGYETDTGLVKYGDGASAWVDLFYAPAGAIETQVQNASGSTIPKGSVVYISGANGNNPLISLADADTEATSSKTIGITAESIANGAQGKVVESGILTGINTGSATIGQSVWLSSTAGGVVYGAPPAKPAHSVYLGVVIRVHANNGAILVKVQNGYEVNELHDVQITSPANNNVLAWDSALSMWRNETAVEAGLMPYVSYAVTAKNAGTTNLTSSSAKTQRFTGLNVTHTVRLPDATTLQLGDGFRIINADLVGTLSISDSSGLGMTTIRASTSWTFICVDNTVSGSAGWNYFIDGTTTVTGQNAIVLQTSPALLGTPTAPTAAADTNTTQIATTAYVVGQGYLKSATAASTYAAISHTHTAAQVTPGTSDKSANYTLVSGDAQTIIRSTNSAITITVPDVLSSGQRIDFIQAGAGQITFAGSGITINSVDSKLKTNKQYSGATIMKVGTAYYLVGDLAA